MADKEPVTGRLPADTKKRFDEFREETNLSQSDAVRRLIDTGLQSYEQGSVLLEEQLEGKTPWEKRVIRHRHRNEKLVDSLRGWIGEISVIGVLAFTFGSQVTMPPSYALILDLIIAISSLLISIYIFVHALLFVERRQGFLYIVGYLNQLYLKATPWTPTQTEVDK